MSEQTANAALHSYVEQQATERAKWAKVLAATPARKPVKKQSIITRFLGIK